MPLTQVARAGAVDDVLPLLAADERILYKFLHIELYFGQRRIGDGSLVLTSLNVIWLHTSEPHLNYSVDYRSITIHAVSKDSDAFQRATVYCQLDTGDSEDEYSDDDGRNTGGAASEIVPLHRVFELRFAPDNADDVDAIYAAMSEGAALNPDEDDEGDEENGDFFDADSLQVASGFDLASLGLGGGSARLAHIHDYDDDEEGEEYAEHDDVDGEEEDDEDQPEDVNPDDGGANGTDHSMQHP